MIYHAPNTKEKAIFLGNIVSIEFIRSFKLNTEINLSFVNIIRKKNDNFDLALRKRRFCAAKEPLLPCKTYAFGMQNNRFCNILINK